MTESDLYHLDQADADPYHPDQADLLAALADAEWEMYELGSCLKIPGNLRFRLLEAATRAHRLIASADETDMPQYSLLT